MKKPIYISRSFGLALFIWFPIAKSLAQDQMKPMGEEATRVLFEMFQYDKTIPLEAQVIDTLDSPEFVRERIVFTGARGSRVPGFLAFPKNGTAPYPCVLLLHGYTPDGKEVFWDRRLGYQDTLIRISLLKAGVAVMTLDAPFLGQRSAQSDFISGNAMIFRKRWPYRALDILVQATIDHRRAIDYLETRPEIDAGRIGALGYSGGGMTIVYLSAVDSRPKVLVPCITALNIYGSLAPEVLALWHYVQALGDRPVLYMMSKHDRWYSVEQAEQLFSLIKSPSKQLLFFEIEGHRLPAEHAPKAVEWFQKYLK